MLAYYIDWFVCPVNESELVTLPWFNNKYQSSNLCSVDENICFEKISINRTLIIRVSSTRNVNFLNGPKIVSE